MDPQHTHKKLVENILKKHNYDKKSTCLIGDSLNDYEAAKVNNINFYGYNNTNLKVIGKS
jgi:histidinol phosphatase-like enzyme